MQGLVAHACSHNAARAPMPDNDKMANFLKAREHLASMSTGSGNHAGKPYSSEFNQKWDKIVSQWFGVDYSI